MPTLMSNILKDLQHIIYHQKHICNPDHVAALSTPEMIRRAEEADNSDEVRVFLVIAALKGLAFDPMEKDPIIVGETHTTFKVRFHTVSNPFGAFFTLPNTSLLAQRLESSISANLDSEMYRAAKEYRRLQPIIVKEESELRDKATKAYNLCYGETRDKDKANEAYDAVFLGPSEVLNEHIRSVANAACPALAGKCYSDWLAELLYYNL